MHTAVRSSAAALTPAQSSLECGLTLKSLYALKVSETKLHSLCFVHHMVAVTMMLTWSLLPLFFAACNVEDL